MKDSFSVGMISTRLSVRIMVQRCLPNEWVELFQRPIVFLQLFEERTDLHTLGCAFGYLRGKLRLLFLKSFKPGEIVLVLPIDLAKSATVFPSGSGEQALGFLLQSAALRIDFFQPCHICAVVGNSVQAKRIILSDLFLFLDEAVDGAQVPEAFVLYP